MAGPARREAAVFADHSCLPTPLGRQGVTTTLASPRQWGGVREADGGAHSFAGAIGSNACPRPCCFDAPGQDPASPTASRRDDQGRMEALVEAQPPAVGGLQISTTSPNRALRRGLLLSRPAPCNRGGRTATRRDRAGGCGARSMVEGPRVPGVAIQCRRGLRRDGRRCGDALLGGCPGQPLPMNAEASCDYDSCLPTPVGRCPRSGRRGRPSP